MRAATGFLVLVVVSARALCIEGAVPTTEVPDATVEDNSLGWMTAIDYPGAAEWQLISFSPNNDRADFATLRMSKREGPVATVWLRSEYREARKAQSSATQYAFHCSDFTMQFLSNTNYEERNLEGGPDSYNTPGQANPILPGTIAETWMNWACKATKPKATKPTANPPTTTKPAK